MTEPLVTAICCAYNYARWLPLALDSALAQGHGPETLEVVVVDDGSTDDTPEVVQPYLRSPVVRYVRKANGGFPSAVSRGFDEARGRYVVFLDADDEWPADRLGRQVEALERNPDVGLVYSDMEVIDESGRLIHRSYLDASGIDHPSGRLLGRLYDTNVVSGGALMVRSALSDLFNPIPSELRCQDWWIATQVATVADILWVPGTVYRYRLHGSNMNLGQSDRTANIADDLAFRRLSLARPEADLVPVPDLLLSARRLALGPDEYRNLGRADPDAGFLHEQRAVALCQAGRHEAALRELVRAQAADPPTERAPLFAEIASRLDPTEQSFAAWRLAAI